MATATRVAQAPQWVQTVHQVPQPDRLHLDLSLMEAHAVLYAVRRDCPPCLEALRTALYSTTSTPVSPEQANAMKVSARDAGYDPKTTQGAPLAASAVEAERYKMLRELAEASKKIAAAHVPFIQKQ